MKTLKDHVILYDAVCPMCNLYTKGFVQSGMLEKEGRVPYQNMPDNIARRIDQNRMVNEIALLHKPSGKVYYGVESLLRIIGNSAPSLKFLLSCETFMKIADMVYKFISFNRRVIVPSRKVNCEIGHFDPKFHKGYRVAYLVFTWLLTSLILYKFSFRIAAILPYGEMFREFLVCGGQIIWQSIVVGLTHKSARWEYLGNMMTISFAGALLLGFGMVLGKFANLHNDYLYAGYFSIVVALMFFEHIRRTKLLGLGWTLSFTWVLYRIMVLFIIFLLSYVK